MSLTIDTKIMNITTALSATIDLKKLGPIQKSALKKMCRLGVIKQNSIVSRLARQFLEHQPHIYAGNYHTMWLGVPTDPEHPTRRALIACRVLEQLEGLMLMRPRPLGITSTQWKKGLADALLVQQAEEELLHTCENTYAGTNKRLYLANTKPLDTVNFKHEFEDAFFEREVEFNLLIDELP